MNTRRPEAESKPFALVAIPSQPPGKARATTHERFQGLTGYMDLTITVESGYLFVGSGNYEFDPDARGDRPDVWYTFYRRSGQICIPGTSIKGAIRAIVEAISNSCVSQIRSRERVRASHQRCRFRDEKSPLCPACRLFGSTGLRGRVHFSDALPHDEIQTHIVKIAELWEPRRWEAKRRFYEVREFQEIKDRRPRRNFRFIEAVPEASCFYTRLYFENISMAELGLLCYALGLGIEGEKLVIYFTPKIGGAKPRCLGAVTFDPFKIKLLNLKNLFSYRFDEYSDNDLDLFVAKCLDKCKENSDIFHSDSWKSLTQKLQPKSSKCPGGIY